jgi:hypothetical protein
MATSSLAQNIPAAATAAFLATLVTVAGAADRFVAPAGTNTSNCLISTAPCATVSYATSQATSGDTVNVAGGQYRDNIRMMSSATMAFVGGWDATFTGRDPRTTPSILKAGQVHLPTYTGPDRVWSIFAWNGTVIHVTIDGFVLLGGRAGTPVVPDNLIGDAAANAHAAGGLAAVAAADSVLTLQMSNTIVTKNRDAYGGAGLSLWALDNSVLDVTLDTIQVTRNKSTGGGGGILVFDAPYLGEPSSVTFHLSNSVVADNRTIGGGGGILASDLSAGSTLTATIVSSAITRNSARNAKACPAGCLHLGGGGIFAVAPAPVGPLQMTLTDTILYGNRLIGLGAGVDFFEYNPPPPQPSMVTVNADHNDIGDVVMSGGAFNYGAGSLSTNPLLARGYELQEGSPLVDAGSCTGALLTDFEGDPRPSGAGCDIGADEFQF